VSNCDHGRRKLLKTSSVSKESICQNFSASELLVQDVAGLVSQHDVELIARAQEKVLQRFEKTNEMLSNVNILSQSRLSTAQREFKIHTQNLLEMKKEMEGIFKRIRKIKEKLADQMPTAYHAVVGKREDTDKEEDDEYDIAIKQNKEKTNASRKASV